MPAAAAGPEACKNQRNTLGGLPTQNDKAAFGGIAVTHSHFMTKQPTHSHVNQSKRTAERVGTTGAPTNATKILLTCVAAPVAAGPRLSCAPGRPALPLHTHAAASYSTKQRPNQRSNLRGCARHDGDKCGESACETSRNESLGFPAPFAPTTGANRVKFSAMLTKTCFIS